MNIKICTRSGRVFDVDSEVLEKIGKQNLLTFLCRRETHRERRSAGFNPTEQEIAEYVSNLKLSKQFQRFGDTGYRDLEMRVFGGHRISEGAARRLSEIQEIDVSDIDFKKIALGFMRETWEFECRLDETPPELFFRRELHPEQYCKKCCWHESNHHPDCENRTQG